MSLEQLAILLIESQCPFAYGKEHDVYFHVIELHCTHLYVIAQKKEKWEVLKAWTSHSDNDWIPAEFSHLFRDSL